MDKVLSYDRGLERFNPLARVITYDDFDNGFNGLINFEFRWDAEKDYETIFSKYSQKLNNVLEGSTVLNYLSSHDDGNPFDDSSRFGGN